MDWNSPDEHPVPGPPINYPNGAPEFKMFYYAGVGKMVFHYNENEMRFKTINEFKRSIHDGGEIIIEWQGSSYGIFFNGTQFYMTAQNGTTDYFKTADALLKRYISGDRLRDIITQVTVLDRAL